MQPTARSNSHASDSIATDPAEWHRSHRMSAPASCAICVRWRRVGEVAGAVRDLAQHDHGGLATDRLSQRVRGDARRAVDLDPAHPAAALGGDALDEVAVRGEVVGVDHDLHAGRVRGVPAVERGSDELVQQHGGRVADDGLTRRRPDHGAADRVADLERKIHPGLVPPADQATAPLLVHEPFQPFRAAAQRAAERVAVEIHQRRLGADELVAAGREAIGCIEGCGLCGERVGGRACVTAVNRGHRGSAPR